MQKFLKKNYLIILALLYVLSPIDLISDVLPILGISDDIVVLLITAISKYIDYKKEKTQKEKQTDFKSQDIKEGELVE